MALWKPKRRSRYSNLGAWRTGVRTSVAGEFLTTKRPDRFWGPLSLQFNGHRGSFPGIKRPGCGVYHSPPPRTQVRNKWSYTSATHVPSWLRWYVAGLSLQRPRFDPRLRMTFVVDKVAMGQVSLGVDGFFFSCQCPGHRTCHRMWRRMPSLSVL